MYSENTSIIMFLIIIWMALVWFAFFVVGVNCISPAVLPTYCQTESVHPENISFPSGKGAVQIEAASPMYTPNNLSFPSLEAFAWILYDSKAGLRVDFPNPELLMGDEGAFPILFSIFVIPAEGVSFIAVPMNRTCYRSNFNQTSTSELVDPFFQQFTYQGEDNVNSYPSYKWSRKIPLLGTFQYYETCLKRRAPLQLDYLPSEIITNIIKSKLSEITALFRGVEYPVLPEERAKLLKMIKEQNYDVAETYRNSAVYVEEQASFWPNHTHFSLPSFSWLSSLSTYSSFLSSGYSSDTSEASTEESTQYDSSLNYESETTVEDEDEDEDVGGDLNNHSDFIVSRVAFINWVNGVIDPTSMVPPLYCLGENVNVINFP